MLVESLYELITAFQLPKMQISHFSRVYSNTIPSIDVLDLIYPQGASARLPKFPDGKGMSTKLRAAQLSISLLLRQKLLRIFVDTANMGVAPEDMSALEKLEFSSIKTELGEMKKEHEKITVWKDTNLASIGKNGSKVLTELLIHANAVRDEAIKLVGWEPEIDVPTILPSLFVGSDKKGDFKWMINSGQYEDALFIFNDNVEDHKTADVGGGNAIIRPFNRYGIHKAYPRSAGIPTGQHGTGFKILDTTTKKHIDEAVEEIRELIQKHRYKRIYFSSNRKGGLGVSIFRPSEDVKRYIVKQIKSLGKSEEETLLNILEMGPFEKLANPIHTITISMQLVNDGNGYLYNFFSTKYDAFPGTYLGKRTFASLKESIGDVSKYCGVWFSFDLPSSYNYFERSMSKLWTKKWEETFVPSIGLFKLKRDIPNILVFTRDANENIRRLEKVIEDNQLSKPHGYEALLEKYRSGEHTATNYYLAAIICRIKEINGWIVWGDSYEVLIKNPSHFISIKYRYEITHVFDSKNDALAFRGLESVPYVNYDLSSVERKQTWITSEPPGFGDIAKQAYNQYSAKIDPKTDLGLEENDLM